MCMELKLCCPNIYYTSYQIGLRKIFFNICNHSNFCSFFSPKNDFTQYAGYLNGHQIATSAHEKLATSSSLQGPTNYSPVQCKLTTNLQPSAFMEHQNVTHRCGLQLYRNWVSTFLCIPLSTWTCKCTESAMKLDMP